MSIRKLNLVKNKTTGTQLTVLSVNKRLGTFVAREDGAARALVDYKKVRRSRGRPAGQGPVTREPSVTQLLDNVAKARVANPSTPRELAINSLIDLIGITAKKSGKLL